MLAHFFNPFHYCFFFSNYILIHLNTAKSKFDTLCMMIRKLFAFVSDGCIAETEDAISMQEVTLGGHVYLQLVKEKLIHTLNTLKYRILHKCNESSKFVLNEG